MPDSLRHTHVKSEGDSGEYNVTDQQTYLPQCEGGIQEFGYSTEHLPCDGDIAVHPSGDFGHVSIVKHEDHPQGYNYHPQHSFGYLSRSGDETPETSDVRPLTTFAPGTYCYKLSTKAYVTYKTPEADIAPRRSVTVDRIKPRSSYLMTPFNGPPRVAEKDNERFSRWASKAEPDQEAIRALYGRSQAYTDPSSKLEYLTIDIIVPEDSLRCHLDVTLITKYDERCQDSAGDICLAGSLDLAQDVHTDLFQAAQLARERASGIADDKKSEHREFGWSIDIAAAKLGEDTQNVIDTRDERPQTTFRFQPGFSIIQPKSGAYPGFRSGSNSSKEVIPGPYAQHNGKWRTNLSYIVTMHPMLD